MKTNETTKTLLIEKKEKLKKRKLVLKKYIFSKLEEDDYHAVPDACNDIREIEREIFVLSEMLKLIK